jgi:hypothetical protein
MFTATAVTHAQWQPSTGADTERARVGGLYQHHTRVGSSRNCGRPAAAARGLLGVFIVAAPGASGVEAGAFFKSGHERFTQGGNLPTLTPGAPALVIDCSSTSVLRRPHLWLGRRRQPRGAPNVAVVLGVPASKVGTSEVHAWCPRAGTDTGRTGVSDIHISTTDVVEHRGIVAAAPPHPQGSRV